jgi:diadenosine tetraphosphatase ApaH/serine/threonine PP2A family protein phosphatase
VAYALISDLHSNLSALKAVFADIDAQGVTTVHCLGDVIGYGPEPAECVDLVMERVEVTLKGNHDEALIHGAHCFGNHARSAIEWTQKQLKPGLLSGPKKRKRWKFLSTLPLKHAIGPDLLVHGSPRDPTMEYLLPPYVENDPKKYQEVFETFERRLFVGHTHLPGVITDGQEWRSSQQLGGTWRFPDGCQKKAIVNVGSVGQPRDDDPRACYAIVDGDAVHWRRVEYDIEATVGLIAGIDPIHPSLGDRLRKGM